MKVRRNDVVISCEHGGKRVPRRYTRLFTAAGSVLSSHRGYDPGALELAKRFAQQLGAVGHFATVTRLLVELNRSPRHPQLFSEYTADLSRDEKERLLADYYIPYRHDVTTTIAEAVAAGTSVCHLSVHTFTSVLRGVTRHADVGLLYDPRRRAERELCVHWQQSLSERRPDLRVRRNYPYLGRADGFTTALRRSFSDDQYRGVELEVNQHWPQHGGPAWRVLQNDLIATFRRSLQAGK